MNGDNGNSIRPNFSAWRELYERRPFGIVESLARMGRHSIPALAILALGYIAGKIVEASSELTWLTLVGALIVALLIAGIAITVFLVEQLSNAKIDKKAFDKSTEPTDE